LEKNCVSFGAEISYCNPESQSQKKNQEFLVVHPHMEIEIPTSICTNGRGRNLKPYALNKRSFPRAEQTK
jgi:hypothetical protein